MAISVTNEAAALGIFAPPRSLQRRIGLRIPYLQMGTVTDDLDLTRESQLFDPLGRYEHASLPVGFNGIQAFVDAARSPAVFFALEYVQRLDVLSVKLLPCLWMVDADAGLVIL